MFFEHLQGPLEALLFASGDPVSASKLAEILEVKEDHIHSLIAELQKDMTASHRGLTIVEVAGGYQLSSKPELAGTVEKLAVVQDNRLSTAALETLSIIAFKQPITRQEIENIRGVKADRMIHNLLERRLIKELGRKDAIGRPILYGTTDEFLCCLGLRRIQDLPSLADFIPSAAAATEKTDSLGTDE